MFHLEQQKTNVGKQGGYSVILENAGKVLLSPPRTSGVPEGLKIEGSIIQGIIIKINFNRNTIHYARQERVRDMKTGVRDNILTCSGFLL